MSEAKRKAREPVTRVVVDDAERRQLEAAIAAWKSRREPNKVQVEAYERVSYKQRRLQTHRMILKFIEIDRLCDMAEMYPQHTTKRHKALAKEAVRRLREVFDV